MTRMWVSLVALALVAGTGPSGAAEEAVRLDKARFLDKCKGGWAGQMVGVMFGMPYEWAFGCEGFRYTGEPILEDLKPWEPEWRQDELWRSSYRRRIRHYQREAREDLGYAFGVFETAEDRLVGGLTLGNVRRGVMQCATLGYWLGVAHIRRGHMSDAVRTVIPYAFGKLRLHRLEAASMPSNTASISVLERAGFAREGLARRYLKISGSWQDHIRFALLADETDEGADGI